MIKIDSTLSIGNIVAISLGLLFLILFTICVAFLIKIYIIYNKGHDLVERGYFDRTLKKEIAKFKLKPENYDFDIKSDPNSIAYSHVDIQVIHNKKKKSTPIVPTSNEVFDEFNDSINNSKSGSKKILVLGPNRIGKTVAVKNFYKAIEGYSVYIKINVSEFRNNFGDQSSAMIRSIMDGYNKQIEKLAGKKRKVTVTFLLDEMDDKDNAGRKGAISMDPKILKPMIEELFQEIQYSRDNENTGGNDENNNSNKKNNITRNLIMCGNNPKNFEYDVNAVAEGESSAFATAMSLFQGKTIIIEKIDTEEKAKLVTIRVVTGQQIQLENLNDTYDGLSPDDKRRVNSVVQKFNEISQDYRSKTKGLLQTRLLQLSSSNVDCDALMNLYGGSPSYRRMDIEEFVENQMKIPRNISRNVITCNATATEANFAFTQAVQQLEACFKYPFFSLKDVNDVLMMLPNTRLNCHVRQPAAIEDRRSQVGNSRTTTG